MKNLNSNLILHFKKPHNFGEISCPDAVGKSGRPECPGNIIFTARINKNIIRDIKFKASGCSYTIAAASYLTTLSKNKDILKSTLIPSLSETFLAASISLGEQQVLAPSFQPKS